jgi:hypothetical protein
MFSSSKKMSQNQSGLDAAIYVGDAAMQLAQIICEDNEYNSLDVFLTCAALFYIEIDRRAFKVLSAKDRESFTDSMQYQLIEKVYKNWGVAKDYQAHVGQYFYEQVKKLSPYTKRLVPEEKGGARGGTLYWEFGKLLDDDFADGTVTFSLTILFSITPIASWLNKQMDTLIP